jgi:hypothetical protein
MMESGIGKELSACGKVQYRVPVVIVTRACGAGIDCVSMMESEAGDSIGDEPEKEE